MSVLVEKMIALTSPIIESEGFELVRLRFTGSKTKTLQIMAERPDGTMTAEECAKLSRALSVMLDEVDPIEDDYVLEVSSPGIDRPLTRLKDFERWAGFDAKLTLNTLVEGRKRFKGVLDGVEDDNILIDLEGEEETTLIPFSLLDEGKLVLTDELIRESLRAAKAQEENSTTDEENMEKSDGR